MKILFLFFAAISVAAIITMPDKQATILASLAVMMIIGIADNLMGSRKRSMRYEDDWEKTGRKKR